MTGMPNTQSHRKFIVPNVHCLPKPVATPQRIPNSATLKLNKQTQTQISEASSSTSVSFVNNATIESFRKYTKTDTEPNTTTENTSTASTIIFVRRTETGIVTPILTARDTPKENGTIQKAMIVWFGIV
mmetsp:Transcript_1824/g.4224  ORF Transcript_1824/g.4224 Transcript_1824/m.4224 type:complete len:129 (-) Transcript_1824:936-1322(-)